MADYLTLLARRSLGLAEPVRPAFVHRFADGTPSVEEPPGRTTADDRPAIPPAMAVADGGSPGGVRPPARETGPVRSPSPAAPAVDRDPPTRDTPSGPTDRTGSQAHAGSERSQGEQSRRIRPQDRVSPSGSEPAETRQAPELLLPVRPDRTAVERAAESRSSAEAKLDGDRSLDTGDGPPPSRPRSADRTPGQEDRPFGIDDGAIPPEDGRVTIAIGTVEVRAVTPAPPSAVARPRRGSPRLGLDDYLAQRGRGER